MGLGLMDSYRDSLIYWRHTLKMHRKEVWGYEQNMAIIKVNTIDDNEAGITAARCLRCDLICTISEINVDEHTLYWSLYERD
jgi:hypothetical protein